MLPQSDISVFVRTVDLGSFAAVSDEVGLTPSGVSRIVSRLEDRLGAKLLHRSTRRLVLTQEGEVFLPHARSLLDAMEVAEADVASSHGQLRGPIKINSGTAFARHKLLPHLNRFTADHPDISIDLSVSDRRIDPVADQVDITIRIGPLADSDLVAVKLGEVRRVIAASPDYLARHGTPQSPEDLQTHQCLRLSGFSRHAGWPMRKGGRTVMLPVRGRLQADSADALFDMCVAGLGIAWIGDFLAEDALRSGRLVPLLEGLHEPDPQPITALVPQGRQRLPRIRCMLDHLKQAVASG